MSYFNANAKKPPFWLCTNKNHGRRILSCKEYIRFAKFNLFFLGSCCLAAATTFSAVDMNSILRCLIFHTINKLQCIVVEIECLQWLFYSLYAFKYLDTFHRIQSYFNFSFKMIDIFHLLGYMTWNRITSKISH